MKRPTAEAVSTALGDYDLLDLLGEGSAGIVYKARQRWTGQLVAVKVLPSFLLGKDVMVRRFEQEFRAASALCHPHIVHALDFHQVNGKPFLVMELVEGESLGEKLERDGRLGETEAVHLIAQVGKALDYAHDHSIFHRDVKPDNILVTPRGVAKLTDLGLAKEKLTNQNLTRTGRGLGTPHFMAPEQFRDAKNVDHRCDIYGLGATLYMMVTGELPFSDSSPLEGWIKKSRNELPPPRRLVPSLSARVDQAILRAMSADPAMRQNSCLEFVQDLTGLESIDDTVPTSVPTSSEVWTVRYEDGDGKVYPIRGEKAAIRQILGKVLPGTARNVCACRQSGEAFMPLDSYPEFRDLAERVAAPARHRMVPAPAARGMVGPGERPDPVGPRASFQFREWAVWLLLLISALVGGLLAGRFLFSAK